MRRVLPFGDRAILIDLDGEDPLALHAAALDDPDLPAGVLDLVPGARTLLIKLDAGVAPGPVGRWCAALDVAARSEPTGDPIRIAVRYDGPDLDAVAAELGIDVPTLIARHTSSEWRAAFLGFLPGFAYLEAPNADLAVARLDSPRTEVPAGSVAIAGGYSAIYPRTSPGGWRLIGTTVAVDDGPVDLFPGFPRIPSGARVRFEVAE